MFQYNRLIPDEISVFTVLSLMFVLSVCLLCCEGLGRAFTESVSDSTTEFNQEYGAGATRSLARGSEGIISVDPYRNKINYLYEENKISASLSDRRLDSLFSAYDAYKKGSMSKASFKQHAEALTVP